MKKLCVFAVLAMLYGCSGGPGGDGPAGPQGIKGEDGEYYRVNTTFAGTLTENEIWSGNVTVTDSVTVPAGKTLVIDESSVVTVTKDLGRIYVYGSLFILGEDGKRVTIKSDTGVVNDWDGIWCYHAERVEVQYAEIRDAKHSILLKDCNNVYLYKSKFVNSNDGIYLRNCTGTAEYCTFTGNTQDGVKCYYSEGRMTFDRCEFLNNTQSGIEVELNAYDPDSPLLIRCNLTGNGAKAVEFMARLYNCYVADNNGQAGFTAPADAGTYNYSSADVGANNQLTADMISAMRATTNPSIGCGW